MCGGDPGLFPSWAYGLGLGSMQRRLKAEAKEAVFYEEL